MSGDIASPFSSGLRTKRRLAVLLAVVLAAWLFEFATHIHAPETSDVTPHHVQHVCTFCATLAAGAGPSGFAVHLPFPQVAFVQCFFASIPPSVVRIAAYRSRAPPSIALA
jgi:hypothetical protein